MAGIDQAGTAEAVAVGEGERWFGRVFWDTREGRKQNRLPVRDCFIVSGPVSGVVSRLFGVVSQWFPLVSCLIVSALFPHGLETMVFNE
jgi:hypothetical protein